MVPLIVVRHTVVQMLFDAQCDCELYEKYTIMHCRTPLILFPDFASMVKTSVVRPFLIPDSCTMTVQGSGL